MKDSQSGLDTRSSHDRWMKIGLSYVGLVTLFVVVRNIDPNCYTCFRLNNIVDNYVQRQNKIVQPDNRLRNFAEYGIQSFTITYLCEQVQQFSGHQRLQSEVKQ